MAVSVVRQYNELVEAQRVALEEQVEKMLADQAKIDLPAAEVDIRNAKHDELGLASANGWTLLTAGVANNPVLYINYTLGTKENLAFLEFTDPDDAINSIEIANQTTTLAVLEQRHGGSRFQRIGYPRDIFTWKKQETIKITVKSPLVATTIRVPLKIVKAEPKGTTVGGKPCPA